jgi:hypothetical protein
MSTERNMVVVSTKLHKNRIADSFRMFESLTLLVREASQLSAGLSLKEFSVLLFDLIKGTK